MMKKYIIKFLNVRMLAAGVDSNISGEGEGNIIRSEERNFIKIKSVQFIKMI